MLYLFDVDGTLIRSFLREGDTAHDYDDVELLEGRRDAILSLAAEGVKARLHVAFGLVTNQAGVAMGYQTPDQVRAKMARVVAALEFFGGAPFSIHICMHHPDAKLPEWRQKPCVRRKPNPGMIAEAMDAHRVFPDDTLFVGDMDTDAVAARSARVDYVDAGAFFGCLTT